MSSNDATLLDMLKAARLALEFAKGLSQSQFFIDVKTQSAVLHQLLILGEAVKRLSPEFREQHDTVPWKRIAGMRDRVIHRYNNVDLELVWTTLQSDLNALVRFLVVIVPEPPREKPSSPRETRDDSGD